MTRDEIINQILKPAFNIGLRRAKNSETYITEHCVNGTNFVKDCSDEAIQNLNRLIVILKEYGYWTEDRRFIGQYTDQPHPYSNNPHISIRQGRVDISRICFVNNNVNGERYFGISFKRNSHLSSSNTQVTNTYDRKNSTDLRWAPVDMNDFLKQPEKYLVKKK
jgi:hypothetical protein